MWRGSKTLNVDVISGSLQRSCRRREPKKALVEMGGGRRRFPHLGRGSRSPDGRTEMALVGLCSGGGWSARLRPCRARRRPLLLARASLPLPLSLSLPPSLSLSFPRESKAKEAPLKWRRFLGRGIRLKWTKCPKDCQESIFPNSPPLQINTVSFVLGGNTACVRRTAATTAFSFTWEKDFD